MTHDQYLELQVLSAQPPVVCGHMLTDQTNRTLVYGYTCERHTFHVYLEQGDLIRVIYDHDGLCLSVLKEIHGQGLAVASCLPDKRAYPERCDYEFAQRLLSLGSMLPFTTWPKELAQPVQPAQPAQPAAFFGKKFEELSFMELGALRFCPASILEALSEKAEGAEGLALVEQVSALPPTALASLAQAAESCVREQLFRAEIYGGRDTTPWLSNALGYLPELLRREGSDASIDDTAQAVLLDVLKKMTALRVTRLRQLQAQGRELAHAA